MRHQMILKETHYSTRCFKANGAPSFDLIYKNLHLVRKFIPDCNINLRINVNKENPENLRKALLEGYLTKITGAMND